MCYMTASGDTTPSVLAGTWMGGNSALSTIGADQKKLGGHLLKEDSWVQFAIWASSKEFAKRWFLQTIDVYFPTQIITPHYASHYFTISQDYTSHSFSQ